MGFTYPGLLLVSIGCMVALDSRFRLFFFADARRASVVMAVGVVFFLLWDLGGIGLDIFHRGETDIMLGLVLAPHLPVEEVFFLAFLCYVTMVLFGLAGLVLRRPARSRPARSREVRQ